MSRPAERGRVAVFLPALAGGGAERAMLLVARGLVAEGWRVDLVLADRSGPLLQSVPKKVRLVDLGSKSVSRALIPLAKYLRRTRPQGLISAMTHANLIAVMAAKVSGVHTRILVSEQNHLTSQLNRPAEHRQRLFPLLIRLFYPMADHVLTVSEGIGDDLAARTKIPRERFETEHNPVPIGELIRAGEEAPQSLDPFLDTLGPPVLISVGRLTRQKDFQTLLRAVSKAKRGCRLIILGEGEDRPELTDMVRTLGLEDRVRLPGFVPNPYPYLARASVYVMSSRWEGMPTVLLEAMALGMPIVSTDCPTGPRELLKHGRLGWLVPVEDDEALAAALDEAVEALPMKTEYEMHPFEYETVVRRYSRRLDGDRPCRHT